MAIVPLSGIDADQRALDRLLQERAQRDQIRLAQLQADADAEQLREQQILADQQAQTDLDRLRDQRELDVTTLAQQDALTRQSDRLAQQRIFDDKVTEQRLDDRVRLQGQNAYRAQSTPPPPASSLTDVLA